MHTFFINDLTFRHRASSI